MRFEYFKLFKELQSFLRSVIIIIFWKPKPKENTLNKEMLSIDDPLKVNDIDIRGYTKNIFKDKSNIKKEGGVFE